MATNSDGPKAGKRAVVSGAAGGIGQAYARRLASEGATVIIIDRLDAGETVKLITDAGGKAVSYHCDLTDVQAVEDTSNAILRDTGGCDILINNAGVGSSRAFDDIDYARFRQTLAINLEAPFLLCRAFVPGMRERRWGRIVNISSSLVNMAVPNIVDYISAKGGVVGLTRALASDLGQFGITVNAIAPGLIRTPLTVEGREGHAAIPEAGFEAVRSLQTIPVGMMPADLVGTMSFLSGDESAMMTGQILTVDAGLTRT